MITLNGVEQMYMKSRIKCGYKINAEVERCCFNSRFDIKLPALLTSDWETSLAIKIQHAV